MASPRQCAILVGGLGTRLGSLTEQTPKPLLPVDGKPFLSWVLRELLRFGIDEAVLLVGHLSDQVIAFAEDAARHLPKPMRICVSREPIRAGTGGALWHARDQLHDRFLMVNGDSLFDTNIASFLVKSADFTNSIVHVLLRETDDLSRYGVVELSGKQIVAFNERPGTKSRGVMNAGIYHMSKDILKYIEPACSLERDVLPELARQRLLTGEVAGGYFIDIGTPQDYARANLELSRRLHRPAVFFDGRVILNDDPTEINSTEQIHWNHGAPGAFQAATNAGLHAFVIFGQPAFCRNGLSRDDTEKLRRLMIDEILGGGGTIDDLRYDVSPTAAIVDLMSKWKVDPLRSFFVQGEESGQGLMGDACVPVHFFSGGDIREFVSRRLDRSAGSQGAG